MALYPLTCNTVILVCVLIELNSGGVSTSNIASRIKRDDKPGEVTAPPEEPCEPYQAVMPNYANSRRRISEIKCYEYIWQLQSISEKIKWEKKCIKKKTYTDKIIGGRDALPNEYPHMAGLGFEAESGKYEIKCGGTLVSPRFVMTAAHCTRANDVEPKIVRFKNLDTWKSVLDINISKIFTHPQYRSPEQYNDIAFVKLEKDLEFSTNVHPACIWNDVKQESYGAAVTITGWGVTKNDVAMGSASDILKTAAVDIIDPQTCNDSLTAYCNRLWCGLQNQICAGKQAGGVDTCQGDSGGPLQVRIPLPRNIDGKLYYVVGITQFGIGCALPNTPGVYVKVSSYLDWIEHIVWNNKT